MQKFLTICMAVLVLLACKSKKKDLSGEDPVDINDFIGFFQELPLPYAMADTQISRKLPDSLLISTKILNQFVPDTVYSKNYGKNTHPKFYALGKIEVEHKETYLLVKAATLARQMAYILCFDEDKNFKAAMPLVHNNPDRRKSITGSIDKRWVVTTSETHKGSDGQQYYKLNAYVYNTAGVFTLIKIESNEPVVPKEVYNPIDTFSRKHKLSGDYVQNKKNFVSVRDGRDAKKLLFFIHFERKDDCSGELKGEAVLVKPNIAQYRQAGDPCVLQLAFSGNKVTLSEVQGCGNYRGIKCIFEGSYTKTKEAAKPKKKVQGKK
ncbi:hypothetical protein [Agriterribacter sp.]|uniref:hypothetical protein n=1 Tax=Agriterribacter sp. TaxID=2821509 RepID=UPI002C3DC09A|nr:hypothetical protein [Agriterribacter sp.]HRO44694.1 hypothetical protein [Agriterribacter sp.]HRQ16366.1 hypothetical protein [Agriterribacter sp.]